MCLLNVITSTNIQEIGHPMYPEFKKLISVLFLFCTWGWSTYLYELFAPTCRCWLYCSADVFPETHRIVETCYGNPAGIQPSVTAQEHSPHFVEAAAAQNHRWTRFTRFAIMFGLESSYFGVPHIWSADDTPCLGTILEFSFWAWPGRPSLSSNPQPV